MPSSRHHSLCYKRPQPAARSSCGLVARMWAVGGARQERYSSSSQRPMWEGFFLSLLEHTLSLQRDVQSNEELS